MTAMRETYSIPALAQTAEPEALEAWMGSAEPCDRILVAEGRVKPQSALAWMVAANWERLHLVTIVAEARDGGGYRWIAERSGAAAEAAPASASRAVRGGRASEPEAPDGTSISDCLKRAIGRAANMGQPAPSLNDLAKIAGLNGASHAKYYVDKLKRMGAIDVETKRFSTGDRRRFAVLDTRGVAVKHTDWGK